MKPRVKLAIALSAIVLILAVTSLPLVPVSQALTLPVEHTGSCGGCEIQMPFSIHGTTSVWHILLGIGSPPFGNPYGFSTNNTYYSVAFVGPSRTPMIFSSLHPFVNSPFLFSSVVLKSNAASYNGLSLAYTVKNVGNRSASAQIYIGNGWSAGIPPLAPGATYSGNSTGWLQGPPVQGSMVTLVVQGYFQNTFSLSVIDTQLTS